MSVEFVLDPHHPVVEGVHQDVLDLACRKVTAFAGFVAQFPIARLLHEIAADREAALGIVLEQHADEESPLGIVDERTLVVAVSDVEITERCLATPLAVASLVFQAPAHVLGKV